MDSPSHFSAGQVRRDDRTMSLVLEGELDLASADDLEQVIREQQAAGNDVLLDLGGLEFIDSTGMRVILNAVNAAKVDGWNLAVAPRLTPAVRRALEITGLLPLLPVLDEE